MVSVCQLLAPLWNPVVSSLFLLEFESSGRKIPVSLSGVADGECGGGRLRCLRGR